MNVVQRGATLFLLSSAALLARNALAQEAAPSTTPTDEAAAAELFEEGRAALLEKSYEVACKKLAESYRLAPHVGSVISLAQCEEASERLALARTHWQQALNLARVMNDPRASFAEERLGQIEPRVPRLTLHPASGSPRSLLVRKDGVVVGAPSFDARLPVEVGEHVVTVDAPGFATKVVHVTLREGETKAVTLELGDALPEPPPVAPLSTVNEESPRPAPPTKGVLVPLAVTSAALGVVAMGFGTGFGVAATLARNDPRGTCFSQSGVCDSAGNARNFAFAEGDASTVLFVAGGALVATGAALWLLAPKRASRSGWRVLPACGHGFASLTVDGAF